MYWIIEPHSDDAYLSLHCHIVGPWSNLPRTIITCYGAGDVIDEAEYYAQATGCGYRFLGLYEKGWTVVDDPRPLAEWLDWRPGDTLVLPLGIRQPAHLRVAGIPVPDGLECLRYLDAKYVQSEAGDELRQKVQGMTVRSVCSASSEKLHYRNIFVRQAHRFMLAPDLYPPSVEIVLEDHQ